METFITIAKNFLNQFLAYLIPIFLLITLGIFLFINEPWDQSANEEPKKEVKLLNYQSQEYGFNLKYSQDFVQGKIAEEDKKKNPIMLRLVRVEPPTLVTFWKETVLGLLDLYSKKPLLEILKTNVDSIYPSKYNDFKKEKIEDIKVANLDGFVVLFTFQDKDKSYREKVKVFVFIKNKFAYYLNCMAPETEWQYAESSCDIIKDNFSFLEKTE